ncbi:MAG TPA: chorismate mutase [Bryobacteraceae bacterium]|nr:chorismate mutase [Bryobacteraceae bacterium]
MTKPQQAQEQLAVHRAEIDRIDLELLALLNRRTIEVEQIGVIKSASSLPVYEPKREDEVYRNVLEHNPGPLTPEAVRRIFERIIDEMRTLQKARMK